MDDDDKTKETPRVLFVVVLGFIGLDLVEGLGLNEFCALLARDESAVGLDCTAAVAVDLEQPRNIELGLLHDLHLAHKHVLGASERISV